MTYSNGIRSLMRGEIDLVNDNIIMLLVDLDYYTPDQAADSVQNDIPEDAQIQEKYLTGKTLDGTRFKADNLVFNNVTGKVGAAVIIQDTGDLATSRLICINYSPDFPTDAAGIDIPIDIDPVNGILSI